MVAREQGKGEEQEVRGLFGASTGNGNSFREVLERVIIYEGSHLDVGGNLFFSYKG